jgi:GTP-binding protein HflX
LSKIIELLIPYDRGDLLAALHREGEVLSTHHDEGGVRVRARLADASAGRLAQFAVAPA